MPIFSRASSTLLTSSFFRRGEGAEPARRAHEHDVAHAVVEGRVRALGDVGDEPSGLADAQGFGVPPLDGDAARVVPQQAQDERKSVLLPTPWGRGWRDTPRSDAEEHVVQHLVLAVGEAEVFHFYAHSRSLLPVMSQRKKGAPTKAVSMPIGMPAVETFLDTLSTMSRKVPPPSMQQGMSQR